MVAQLDQVTPPALSHPTVWGLEPVQLHDRFWASRGVSVVRPGDPPPEPGAAAELFLLTDARTLTVFKLRPLLDTLHWTRPSILFVRLRSQVDHGYREIVTSDERGRFIGVKRSYGAAVPRLVKVALTTDPVLAEQWRATHEATLEWRLRNTARLTRRQSATVTGRAYDRLDDHEVSRFLTELIQMWPDPSATIEGLREISAGVWAPQAAEVDSTARFVGRVWIGAGRVIHRGASVLGPSAVWDDPARRPVARRLSWLEIEPTQTPALVRPSTRMQGGRSARHVAKRLFDFVFALAALAFTLPLYPLIMLAIWLEDGRPFFFAHRRETLGGREFPCLKFRSMRNDAEQIKEQLISRNQADGPQFFMQNDPRLTRVGQLIRKLNLDEIPQFLNVLVGHMSVVGPRPSPRKENQCCPAWREARLSVRPGITGLWQVSRTRQAGADFQEWIKYDIEYVQKASWRLDLIVILKTFRLMVGW